MDDLAMPFPQATALVGKKSVLYTDTKGFRGQACMAVADDSLGAAGAVDWANEVIPDVLPLNEDEALPLSAEDISEVSNPLRGQLVPCNL